MRALHGSIEPMFGWNAPVAELVDAPDLGSGAARRECSSHFRGTIKNSKYFIRLSHFYKFALLN